MAKKKKTKRKLLTGEIGIIHSGTSGKHDERIKAFEDGVALFHSSKPLKPKYAKDNQATLDSDAKSLANANVAVLAAEGGSRAAAAAMKATGTTPIVVTSIASTSRPASNVSGIGVQTTALDAVRLGLLLEMLPGKRKIGALYDKFRGDLKDQQSLLNDKADLLGLDPLEAQYVDPNGTTQEAEIDSAFQSWSNSNCEAAIITADPLFNNHIKRIVKTAGNVLRTMPAIYQWREFVEAGGLMSYGPNLSLAYKLAGTFAGRLANDPKAAQPFLVLQSFELVINLKTAKALNINVPWTLLARATDVIV